MRPLDEIARDLDKLAAELRTEKNVIRVPSSGELQATVNSASPHSTILLDPTVIYPGPIYMPATPFLKLKSDSVLPDKRITKTEQGLLATITSSNSEGALHFENKNVGCVVDGVNFTSTPGGHGEVIIIQEATDIILSRILMIADSDGQKRGIRGNGKNITLTKSHIANCIRVGQDSQAFCAWEGAGPYIITDNYLEASGENILFGGADNINGIFDNPSDILIKGNYFFKPLAWKNVRGTVKNLLELKNASRVHIIDNLFENNWTDAQSGWSILFTPRNQDGRAPWSVVKDVLFERNYIKNVERGFNMTGYDDAHVSQQTRGIIIRKNVIETPGHFLQFANEIRDLTVEDNVADNQYNIATLYIGSICVAEGQPRRKTTICAEQWNFNRNVVRHNDYGIIGENNGIGTPALDKFTKGYTFNDNQIAGIKGVYPTSTIDITEEKLQKEKSRLLSEIGR